MGLANNIQETTEEIMDENQRKLLEDNLPLVKEIADKYAERGVPLLDLIQAGNLGLIKAVEKYDPDADYEFKYYASWHIRQAMNKFHQGK
jgi:RNA polymerase sigma factor (sigma-70 family)